MINTWSKFIYGTTVGVSNYLGDFKEGTDKYVATLDSGPYTITELCEAIEDALNETGGQTYTVTFSRTTGKVTIAATSTFSLLLSSGDNVGNGFWSMIGFTSGADQTGTNTYTGNVRAGTEYYPQFLLQSYVGPNDFKQSIDPTVNRTSSGRTELVSFGVDRMIEMELKFITNLAMDGVVIKNNPSGLTAAEAFLTDITTLKSRFEFVPDIATPSGYYKCVCDKMTGMSDGSGFKLKELFMQNLPGIFETGVMTLRVVT